MLHRVKNPPTEKTAFEECVVVNANHLVNFGLFDVVANYKIKYDKTKGEEGTIL